MYLLVAVTKDYRDGSFVDPGEELEVSFSWQDYDEAEDTFRLWTNYVLDGVDSVLVLRNPRTDEGWAIKPSNIKELRLVCRGSA